MSTDPRMIPDKASNPYFKNGKCWNCHNKVEFLKDLYPPLCGHCGVTLFRNGDDRADQWAVVTAHEGPLTGFSMGCHVAAAKSEQKGEVPRGEWARFTALMDGRKDLLTILDTCREEEHVIEGLCIPCVSRVLSILFGR